MNRNSSWFMASKIIGLVFGILFCITIIGAIAGVPLIIGALFFGKCQNMTNEDVLANRNTIMVWGIIFTIIMFPLGAIALVPMFNLEGQIDNFAGNTQHPKTDDSYDEKIRKVEKLHKMKADGLITEGEFEAAKEEILKGHK